MIKISEIDTNLNVYKNGFVILLDIGDTTMYMIDLLKSHKIKIHFICSDDPQYINKKIDNIPCITFDNVKTLTKSENNNVVMQISTLEYENKIDDIIKSLNVQKCISINEAANVLHFIYYLPIIKQNQQMREHFNGNLHVFPYEKTKQSSYVHITSSYIKKDFLFVCLPVKTGDNTLIQTFNSNNIKNFITWHSPEYFDIHFLNSLPQTFKIITAVRDPMSINLSNAFEFISNGLNIRHNYMLGTLKPDFFDNGGDAQTLFDFLYSDPNFLNPIDNFYERFKENVFDLSKYPFDKEKGYSIVKVGNVEVFTYQLEKMDNIITELSNWIGNNEFDSWVKSNEASSKWIAKPYQQAKKEITFSKEFFDCCYDNDWVKHFYSEDDIKKFKDRWASHIKN